MATIELTYGSDSITVDIPDEFLAGPPIRPRPVSGRPPSEAISEALAQPIGRRRLREIVAGKRVAIVVSDEFRSGLQKEIVEHLMEEVFSGDPRHVTFLCATGSHDPSVYASRIETYVRKAAARLGAACDFVAHDCDDPKLVEVGRTSRGTPVVVEPTLLQAEVRVYGHESKHHYMAGYSAIDKQVLPGVSARATIEANHKHSLSSLSGPGRNPWHPDPTRRDNPFSSDAAEARLMTERVLLDPDTGTLRPFPAETFALDMISKPGSVMTCHAGDPEAISALMVQAADRVGMFEVEPARYVLVSPGGPPASQAVYGTQNCFDMALKGALLPGGEACVAAPCDGRPDLPPEVSGLAPDAKSKALFWDNLVRMRDWPMDEVLEYAHEHFELYLWKTVRVLRLFKEQNYTIALHSRLPAELLAQAGFGHVPDVQAWVDERARRGDGKLWVIDQANKLYVRPTS